MRDGWKWAILVVVLVAALVGGAVHAELVAGWTWDEFTSLFLWFS